MFEKFQFKALQLQKIILDHDNPRIVTQEKLKTQDAILEYFFEYEGLNQFIQKIASEGRNFGAERPYVIKSRSDYVVVEGNTRIAAYKVLTGLLSAPTSYTTSIPKISDQLKESLLIVDCSIAPNRDAMLRIIAQAHFGQGDKSKWGYLGSRKAVFDEWKKGKGVSTLSSIFNQSKSEIIDLLLEYELYVESLKYDWTDAEKTKLIDPGVGFNPPIRFLQTKGHKDELGIEYDKTNIAIKFHDITAKDKYRHLVNKLVVENNPGMGATATYAQVFADYQPSKAAATSPKSTSSSASQTAAGRTGTTNNKPTVNSKPGILFSYSVRRNNALLRQLFVEARQLNYNKFPSAGTFLLRNIMETVLKDIVNEQKANKTGSQLSLEKCIDIALSNAVTMSVDDKKNLKRV